MIMVPSPSRLLQRLFVVTLPLLLPFVLVSGMSLAHQRRQAAKSSFPIPSSATTPSFSSPAHESRSSIIRSGLFGTPPGRSLLSSPSPLPSDTDSHKNEEQQQQQQRQPKYQTTLEQRDQFKRDGFVIISGLLSGDETQNLVSAGNKVVEADARKKGGLYFKLAERGVMFNGPGNPDIEAEDRTEITKGFRAVALQSKLPRVAAELMGFLGEDDSDADDAGGGGDETIKVLRDVFLAKGVQEEKCCGWHVDDHSFWPQAYQSSSSSSSKQGINAWIAMQDMPAQYGGSLGLVPGSHKADWRHEAYENLGLRYSSDYEAQTKEQVYQSIKENGFLSCVLDQTNPDLHAHMDRISHVPDLKCGDVIFHTRWLFHKTVPLTKEGKHYYETDETAKTDCLNRYSIRYVPGSAELPLDFVNELAILSNPTSAGKPLNSIPDGDAWYPTVWPALDDDLDVKLKNLALARIPHATKIMQSNLNALLQILSPADDASTTESLTENEEDGEKKQ